MSYINPEIAAHNIAKIFCEHRFNEISSASIKKRANKITAKDHVSGDPDVDFIKEMCFQYSWIYDEAFRETRSLNNSFDDLDEPEK